MCSEGRYILHDKNWWHMWSIIINLYNPWLVLISWAPKYSNYALKYDKKIFVLKNNLNIWFCVHLYVYLLLFLENNTSLLFLADDQINFHTIGNLSIRINAGIIITLKFPLYSVLWLHMCVCVQYGLYSSRRTIVILLDNLIYIFLILGFQSPIGILRNLRIWVPRGYVRCKTCTLWCRGKYRTCIHATTSETISTSKTTRTLTNKYHTFNWAPSS